MADRRKARKKREADNQIEDDKPSKVEYSIAKYLRNKLPQKKTFLLGHKVEYFISSKAIDCLLDSSWALRQKDEKEAFFTTRDSVVDFMQTLIRHKFFHRARKIIVSSKDTKKKKAEADEEKESQADEKGSGQAQSKTITTKSKKEKDQAGDEVADDKEKKKDKKKIKLDMHMEQVFVDGNEPYVWIYDPVPLKAWFIGLGLVFGAVAVCLFPLWPRTVRNYVYYLSIAVAGFLFFVISLAVVRVIIFVIVWMFTLGKHNIWLFPNLTEDVGFFDSFWPLYTYEYKGNKDPGDDKKESQEEKSETQPLLSSEESRKPDCGTISEHSESDNGSAKTGGSNNGNSDNSFEILDSKDAPSN